jgi:RNA polymerase sigma factor (sigma-70 family)
VRILDETVGVALTDAESAAAVAAEAASSSPPLDRAVENQELSDHLWNAIQRLEPMYRVPLVLFHYEEQSYQQIADTMGLTLPAVWQHASSGPARQLAKLLGPVLKQL